MVSICPCGTGYKYWYGSMVIGVSPEVFSASIAVAVLTRSNQR